MVKSVLWRCSICGEKFKTDIAAKIHEEKCGKPNVTLAEVIDIINEVYTSLIESWKNPCVLFEDPNYHLGYMDAAKDISRSFKEKLLCKGDR